jgi:hypothetical protein
LRDPALLLAQQPSSLRTSFRALCTTRIEIKESVIYTAEGDRDSSRAKSRTQNERQNIFLFMNFFDVFVTAISDG